MALTAPNREDAPSPGKIVVIDDEKEVVETVQLILQKDGHRTVTFSDATADLLPSLRKEKPDLIILDIKLPSRDGIEVLKELHKDPDLKTVPIIVCSVIRQKRRIVEALDAGAVDFLTKPFETQELLARVHSALILKEIETHTEDNKQLEDLKKLADTVYNEINVPLSDMKTHLNYLKKTEMAEEVAEAQKLINESIEQVTQIEKALSKYSI